ncbi:hypothetical protein [Ottowia sp. VDI28]|uniref:hypothetical protein n=1 Tax=Ottowia sp. VDI28 TaxID=3133968 RepID=UPI003C2DF617
MRRFFLGFLALLVALGVASCGGGGGHDGTTGNNNSLRMSPLLSNVSLPVGYFSEVAKISQGVKPYYVLSSDASVSAWLLDDDTLVVSGNAAGTSTVAVQDSSINQTSLSLTVTVKGKALGNSIGNTLTLAAGESRTFTITGGMAPYTISSNNNSVATVTDPVNGVVTVTGHLKGTATLLITDDSGATQQMTVTVAGADFSVSPSTGTGKVGTEMFFSIIGGAAPYTVSSTVPSVASVAITGTSVRVVYLAEGKTTLTFKDATGQSFVVDLTATVEAPPVLSLSPSSGTGQAGSSLVFTIVGGTGPFAASSSNPSAATASASGTSVNVSLRAAGTSTITVVDAKGQSSSAGVTVTAAPTTPALTVTPSTQTVQENSTALVNYQISGGVAPYSAAVASGDATIASASVAGTTLIVNVGSSGNRCVTADNRIVPIEVSDSSGKSATVVEIIQGGAATCP